MVLQEGLEGTVAIQPEHLQQTASRLNPSNHSEVLQHELVLPRSNQLADRNYKLLLSKSPNQKLADVLKTAVKKFSLKKYSIDSPDGHQENVSAHIKLSMNQQPRSQAPAEMYHLEAAADKKWFYKKPSGAELGPFLSSEIISRINRGEFDGKGKTEFRAENEVSYQPLITAIRRITRGQLGETYRRIRKDYKKLESKQKELETSMCPEFDSPFDLSQMNTSKRSFAPAALKVAPDVNIVILPPRGTLSRYTLDNVLNVEMGDLFTFQQLESDYDWLESVHSVFAVWAEEHNVVGCRKALVLPAHAVVLKCASPVLLNAIEMQEIEQRKRELTLMGLHPETNTDVLFHRRLQFLIRVTNPESFRVIIRHLYGYPNELSTLEPSLLACVYFEAKRLQIPLIVEEARAVLSRTRHLDALLALAQLTELLQLWDVFSELCEVLSGSVYMILSGQRYLDLGPLGLHRVLSSSSASIDEIQLFIAAHIWLTRRYQKDALAKEDFWTVARNSILEFNKPCEDTTVNTSLSTTNLNTMRRDTNHEASSSNKEAATFFDVAPEYTSDTEEEKKQHIEFGNKIFIYSSIRFCQLSAEQLREIRIALRLDSLLVDGCLRKLLHKELRGRCKPWTANAYFEVDSEGGLFPLRLIRKNTSHARYTKSYGWSSTNFKDSLDHNNQQQSAFVLPYSRISLEPDHLTGGSLLPPSSFWAWTTGDARPVSEAFWAIEVISTRSGRVSIGVASAEEKNLLPNINIPVPRNGTVVWYFNLFSREFYTGVIGNDFRNVNFRLSMTPSGSYSWPRSVRKGDILILQLSVGITTIRITVYLVTENLTHPEAGVSFDFPYHTPQRLRSAVGKRPWAQVVPWIELIDEGDILGYPELRAESMN